MTNKVLWITRTAVFIALLVAAQFFSASLGNQYVTGSLVNLILVVSVLTCGISAGVTVAVLSPVFAFLVGAGPMFPPLIPFIMAGNAVLVLIWFAFDVGAGPTEPGRRYKGFFYAAPVAAAAVKALALYGGVVLIAIPHLLHLAAPQAAMITLMFSFPQFITALVGGVIALVIAPRVKKAVKIH
ncbi:MAG: hypothetical protein FWF33_02210 [Clostridiales bacterium]|nr:hypothetical protein [Clostridiales bacterium]